MRPDLRRRTLVVGAVNLAQSIRRYGHLAAADRSARQPAGRAIRRSIPRRTASPKPTFARCRRRSFDGPVAEGAARCGTSSSGCARSTARRPATTSRTSSCPRSGSWLREAIETGRYRAPADPIDPIALLDRLTRRRGVRAVPAPDVPGQDAVLDRGARHARADPRRGDRRGGRGRHAAGVHRHGASRAAERDGARARQAVRADSRGVQGSGPRRARRSKACSGAATSSTTSARRARSAAASASIWSCRCRRIRAISRRSIRCSKAWRARPAPTRRSRARPTFNPDAVLPILIHGDAAFPGQGVVAETLNLHRLDGLHDRRHDSHHREQSDRVHDRSVDDSYSTLYASGLARGFKIPIVHVNADDPEACVAAARLAFALSHEVPPRRADRSRRLPALRPQRGRRAGVHAAGAVPQDQRASDRARALGADARNARRRSRAGARRRC